MSRSFSGAPLRIRRARSSGRPFRRTAAPTSEEFDGYLARLIKLIPGEGVSAYLVGRQIADNLCIWSMVCLSILVVLIRATATSQPGDGWARRLSSVQWGAVAIAAASFIIWVQTIEAEPLYVPWFTQQVAALAMLVWVPLVPYLYRGDSDVPDEPDEPPTGAPRDVIGDDDRTPVTVADTVPYSSVALVHAFNEGDRRPRTTGTAWQVGPRSWVTAGHVVADRDTFREGRADHVRLWPGSARKTRPDDGVRASTIEVHPRWLSDEDRPFDLALIKVDDETADRDHLQIARVDDATLRSSVVTLVGFPRDSSFDGETMVQAVGAVLEVTDETLSHTIDAEAGQSGAPLWISSDGSLRVVGLHKSGTRHSGAEQETNLAVRFHDALTRWLNERIV